MNKAELVKKVMKTEAIMASRLARIERQLNSIPQFMGNRLSPHWAKKAQEGSQLRDQIAKLRIIRKRMSL